MPHLFRRYSRATSFNSDFDCWHELLMADISPSKVSHYCHIYNNEAWGRDHTLYQPCNDGISPIWVLFIYLLLVTSLKISDYALIVRLSHDAAESSGITMIYIWMLTLYSVSIWCIFVSDAHWRARYLFFILIIIMSAAVSYLVAYACALRLSEMRSRDAIVYHFRFFSKLFIFHYYYFAVSA